MDTEKLIADLQDQIHALSVRLDMVGSPGAELASRVRQLERFVEASKTQDSDLVGHITRVSKALAALQKQVAPAIAKSTKFPGMTVHQAQVVELVADATGEAAKAERAAIKRDITNLQSAFQTAVSQMQASAMQLQAIANDATDAAAHQLQKAVREFAHGRPSLIGAPRATSLILSTILTKAAK